MIESLKIEVRSKDDLSPDELSLYKKLEEARQLAELIGAEFVETNLRMGMRGLLQFGCETEPSSIRANREKLN